MCHGGVALKGGQGATLCDTANHATLVSMPLSRPGATQGVRLPLGYGARLVLRWLQHQRNWLPRRRPSKQSSPGAGPGRWLLGGALLTAEWAVREEHGQLVHLALCDAGLFHDNRASHLDRHRDCLNHLVVSSDAEAIAHQVSAVLSGRWVLLNMALCQLRFNVCSAFAHLYLLLNATAPARDAVGNDYQRLACRLVLPSCCTGVVRASSILQPALILDFTVALFN